MGHRPKFYNVKGVSFKKKKGRRNYLQYFGIGKDFSNWTHTHTHTHKLIIKEKIQRLVYNKIKNFYLLKNKYESALKHEKRF